jgi:hypothetical protein
MGIRICFQWISIVLLQSCFGHWYVHVSIWEIRSKIITLHGQNISCINTGIHLIRNTTFILKGGRISVVGRAKGYGLDDLGVRVRVPVGSRMFSTSSRPALEPTQPRIQWAPGALSPGVKRPGLEADHLPVTSVEVKNMWIYVSTPSYTFVGWCLIKHKVTFTSLYLCFNPKMLISIYD